MSRLHLALELRSTGEKYFDLSWRWHGGLGAVARQRDGGDRSRVFHAGDGICAAQQRRRESAVERIAGGRGVDGLHAIGRDLRALAVAERDVAAALAEFE